MVESENMWNLVHSVLGNEGRLEIYMSKMINHLMLGASMRRMWGWRGGMGIMEREVDLYFSSFVKWHFHFILDPISRHISNNFRVFRILDFALLRRKNVPFIILKFDKVYFEL